jgi:SAM-dependent methyltransferase
VWKELAKTFHPGERVLEIGCGTGVDACFLADRGVRVLACDSSSQMIAAAKRRIREKGHQELLQPLVLRAEDLTTLPQDELFDGAFSNFGVMNCLDDLARFARDLARLLRPGGTALLCWMGPYCLWEMLWYLGHGNQRKAFRRLSREGVNARITDGAFVRVHYPPMRLLARSFAPGFKVKSFMGVGLTVPPSYLEHWAQSHPRLLRVCERADSHMGRWPGIRALADHVLIRFQRENTNSGNR